MINKISRNEQRRKRHKRTRRKVFGSGEMPRLVVYRSNRHLYAQVIDDISGNTLASSNTLQKRFKENMDEKMSNKDMAGLVGRLVAEDAMKVDVKRVVFDRGGNKYHGLIAALADSARKAGLEL
ncbi:MAG: 50S ribosomal protein L18 [Candidatus Eremiobacteraeota bacterium]|nr:50S ribosomal protein L18 [Candidatus Eremiobacteraeota bacterium]